MRKFMITFAAAFSIIAVGLVILMLSTISGNAHVNAFEDGGLKLVNTQEINLDQINSISITYYSDDVKFMESDTDKLILKEYKRSSDKDKFAKISTTGGKLTIKGQRERTYFHMFGITNYGKTEIYLPKKYAGDLSACTSSGEIDSKLALRLKKLDISSSSGDIDMNEAYADEINVTTSSGEIQFQKAEGKRSFSSTSGDIGVYGGSGDSSFDTSSGEITIEKAVGKLEADTNSGDIKISDADGDKDLKTSSGIIEIINSTGFVKASASSGDISAESKKGGADISTSSGEISLRLNEVTDDINLEASSGDVTLKIPEATGFDFTADTSSGDIETFFDDSLLYNKKGNHASGTVGDNPNRKIQINTTSGEIYVKHN